MCKAGTSENATAGRGWASERRRASLAFRIAGERRNADLAILDAVDARSYADERVEVAGSWDAEPIGWQDSYHEQVMTHLVRRQPQE